MALVFAPQLLSSHRYTLLTLGYYCGSFGDISSLCIEVRLFQSVVDNLPGVSGNDLFLALSKRASYLLPRGNLGFRYSSEALLLLWRQVLLLSGLDSDQRDDTKTTLSIQSGRLCYHEHPCYAVWKGRRRLPLRFVSWSLSSLIPDSKPRLL